ncbi:MAG: hypothetical protein FWG66_11090 [Spirochaetes bacterium]|nr:hypothetical protein [Spirochaetota bacterium]
MIFYLNKGRILEEEIVQAVRGYFAAIDLANDYNGISVNVTNEHPFNTLLGSGDEAAASLFPAVVITTLDESKPPGLANLPETGIEPRAWAWEKADMDALAAAGYEVTPGVVEKLKGHFEGRDRLYGVVFGAVRQDTISIEIWCENIALKNQLYEKLRVFACGMMKHALSGGGKLTVFDGSVRGQRSNTFNYDFGVSLAGAQITFEADYIVEQSIIDTELAGVSGDFLLEVMNHAKTGATKSTVRLGTG